MKTIRLLAAVLAIAVFGLAGPASAEWRRAESERFIVYSDGDEGSLRDYVQDLETYDRVLRIFMNLPIEEAPQRKLPIYLVNSHRGLEAVWHDVPKEIVGFYTTSEDDIFAIALRQRDDETTLFHEYAHHFMLQHFAYGYPAWFVEGFAEYFSTADIHAGRVDIGKPLQNSANWLAYGGTWVSMSDVLSKRYWEVGRNRETYYPVSWLLTHWFLSNDARNLQLRTYLTDVGAGGTPIEAMQRATGMTPEALERALKSYLQGRVLLRSVSYSFPRVPVTIIRLEPSADGLLLIGQRLKRPVPEDERADVLQQVRIQAARWPDDPLAQNVLARAELKIGDRATATAILSTLLEKRPDNVEALQLMASVRLADADDATDLEIADRLSGQARSLLGRAFRADDANFTTFYELAEARRGAVGYPNENDLQTLRLAYTLAPQLPGARANLAAALIFKGQREEGVALLQPLLNDPHNSGFAAMARAIMAEPASDVIDEAEKADEVVQDPETPVDEGDPAGPTSATPSAL